MSRRSTPLRLETGDGTSQRGRQLPALDPASVAIDERSHADMLAFVQAFSEQLRFLSAADDAPRDAGTWAPFARRDDISLADIVAHMQDPARFDGERARWLGRPHFALLLAFLELLGKAREQLNGVTARHLDHYFRDVLKMVPEPAVPDRVHVVMHLATGVTEARIAAGTALQAGVNAAGAPRIYRTERELLVNRARVDALRSVHVHRRLVGVRELGDDRDLSPDEAFTAALDLALGEPRPGDPAPRLDGRAVDHAFVRELAPLLDFSERHLHLRHDELRRLMQRLRRRRGADREWTEINRLLRVADPADPRDFAANLARAIGPLDFQADGLPQVRTVDDLFEHRTDPDVRAFIDLRLAAIGHDDFVALMTIKRRIDAEWAEINRLLALAGQRRRNALVWELNPADPTAFEANLAAALDGAWPPPWPPGAPDIAAYDAALRRLEGHLAMSAERLVRLVALADAVASRDRDTWRELDRLLTDAHREKLRAARRAALDAVRGAGDLAGLDAVVRAALGATDSLPTWEAVRARLAAHLDRGQLDVVDHFRRQLADPAVALLFTWDDVLRALAPAQGKDPDAVPRRVEWCDLHAFDDPTTLKADPDVPRWKTFGRPLAADSAHPPAAVLGWALASPSLALSQGTRTLTLTLGLRPFDLATLARDLGLVPGGYDDVYLLAALRDALRLEISDVDDWIELPLADAALASGRPGDDYWTLLGVPRALAEDRGGLRLRVVLPPTMGPVVARRGERSPTLRVTLRHRWEPVTRSWRTAYPAFEPLKLAAVHLLVDVDGLVDLRLQHEDRPLDPGRPFEPFGARPTVGARLLVGHPELARHRLDSVRLDVTWMGLPGSLRAHYRNFPGAPGAVDFKVRIGLYERGRVLPLADAPLFAEGPAPTSPTSPQRSFLIDQIGGRVTTVSPGYNYVRLPEPALSGDLRTAERCLQWELTPTDFGHPGYPALAARKARELAIGLGRGTVTADDADAFAVDPPYTPTIRRLAVAYRTSLELDPEGASDGPDRLLHIHPFGVGPIAPDDPRLVPRYDAAGELYIGLRDVQAPQRFALLVVVAEGTSDPDLDAVPVEWSVLDGDRWTPLGDRVLADATRGLINSGVLELSLPPVAPSALLPPGRYWLRAAIARDPASVCDIVALQAQAVTLVRELGADVEVGPLPAASVDRLHDPDPRIAAVEQPFTSFGGEPPEPPSHFYTRVSERLRHKRRALAPWDYERLVLQRFGAVYKARCLPSGATDGEPGRVDVLVVPDLRARLPSDAFAPRAPADLLARIHEYLAAVAPGPARLVVRNPRYVAVSVRLGVRFNPDQDVIAARRRLNDDLCRFLSPWAYDEGAELSIGGKIYASSIVDFVDRRDYVDYVAEIRLAFSDNGVDFTVLPPTDEDYHVAAGRPDQVLVAARQHHIDIIGERDEPLGSFSGIGYLKVELDFLVG